MQAATEAEKRNRKSCSRETRRMDWNVFSVALIVALSLQQVQGKQKVKSLLSHPRN
jgi:hypothetical protein